jgi:chromosome partitioning protein
MDRLVEVQAAGAPNPAERPVGVRRLLISSPKGGTAKTTASRNLAVLAAQEGLHVAAIDFDPQQSLGNWWSKRPKAAASITLNSAVWDRVEKRSC